MESPFIPGLSTPLMHDEEHPGSFVLVFLCQVLQVLSKDGAAQMMVLTVHGRWEV